MTWAGDLRAGMLTEEAVRDAASAQALKTEHDRIKAEIEAREENFTALVQMADAMIQDGHYAAQVSTFHTYPPRIMACMAYMHKSRTYWKTIL